MNFIMTEGGKRREGILSLLEDTNMPLSGTELARHFNVSRQVIVQDIALLRAEDQKILSTYRGYVLETGTIALSGDAKDLLNNEQVKKAYLSE